MTSKGHVWTKAQLKKRRRGILEYFKMNPKPIKDLEGKLKSKILIDQNGCWVWQGAFFNKPYGKYGQIRVLVDGKSKIVKAHRESYKLYKGEIPTGLELDHLCHNTLCVNPAHLEPVTHLENMRRRKDYKAPNCRHGHSYTQENTYIRPDNGRRECMICRKIRSNKFNAERNLAKL